MKRFNVLSLMILFVGLSVMSCKQEAAADNSGETLATTNTTTPVTTPTPAATPAATPVPTGPTTEITFGESTFDFGEVPEGEKVIHVYSFTNTGKEPLVISNAKGSCGCTVPEWPKDPIAPGEAGKIKVSFDTKGKGSPEGKPNSKKVTITANTDPVNTYLTIKGKVIKDTPSS